MRRAFTLLEVNLAVLVMAGGVLSVVVLYSLGFREGVQSREDVASAAYADAVMSPLVMAYGATNMTWQTFKDLKSWPQDSDSQAGWGLYLNSDGTAISDPEGRAKSAFASAMGEATKDASGAGWSWPVGNFGGLKAGLIVRHEENSGVVRIGFRAAKKPKMLMAAPLYYTEVRFQGVQEDAQ